VALAPDGRRVAAGSRDGKVHVWTLDPPGTTPVVLAGHSGPVTGIAFSPDGSVILSGGTDGAVTGWDVERGRGQRLLRGEAGAVRAVASARATGCLAVAGDRLVLRRPDGSVSNLDGHKDGTLCLAFSADGAMLASGGSDQAVRLWRASDGRELAAFEGHAGPVRAVAFSPDRRFVYSGGADGTLRRWPVRALAALLKTP
jgi:WD40 repeat protein